MKKSIIFIILFFFCFSSSFGQYFTVEIVTGESPYNKQFAFVFPVVKRSSNTDAANAINKALTKDVLGIEWGTQKRSIFENIWGKQEMDIASVSDISFNVINNDARFFCISISATGCGAYCEDWTRYYVFESSTGYPISSVQLFTGQGLQNIIDSVKFKREIILRKQIELLKSTMDKIPLSPDDKDNYRQAISLMDQCSTQNLSGKYLNYSLDQLQIVFHVEKCLPHVIRSLESNVYDFTFDIKSLQDYLTDYGKSLLKQ